MKLSKMQFFAVFIGSIFAVTSAIIQTGVKWDKSLKKFVPIPGLSTYEAERQNAILESRRHETFNFNGQKLNISYFQEEGYFHYYDNDTKASGLVGDIWTILSNFLNFELVLNRSKIPSLGPSFRNGTYTGILEAARLNQTDVIPKLTAYISRLRAADFGPTMWITSSRIFSYGQWKHDRTWMFEVFSRNVWILIFGFIMILSAGSILIQRILIRHRGRTMESENFFHHFFYCLTTINNQPSQFSGTSYDTIGSGSMIFNFVLSTFAFLTLASYNSYTIYSMSAESFEAPFDDIPTLLDNTDYRVVVLNGSNPYIGIYGEYSIPEFTRLRKSGRVVVVSKEEDLYEKVCNYPQKYVMLDSEDSVAIRKPRKCNVIPVGFQYYTKGIISGVSRRETNRRTLYIGIMRLREHGLLDALKKRYMLFSTGKGMSRYRDDLNIDMGQVVLIFYVLGIGIVASIIICVAENIIFILKRGKTITLRGKKLSTINR